MFHSIAKYIFIFFYPFFYLFCFPFLVFLFDSLSFRVISTYLLLFLFCLLCLAVEFLSFLPSYFPLPFKQFFFKYFFSLIFYLFPFRYFLFNLPLLSFPSFSFHRAPPINPSSLSLFFPSLPPLLSPLPFLFSPFLSTPFLLFALTTIIYFLLLSNEVFIKC